MLNKYNLRIYNEISFKMSMLSIIGTAMNLKNYKITKQTRTSLATNQNKST